VNTLSWLIYLSGLVDNVRIVIVLFFIGLFFVVAYGIVGYSDPRDAWRRFMPMFYAAPLAAVVLMLMPSQSTIVKIAASEVVGRVVESHGKAIGTIGDKSLSLLEKYIDAETAKLNKGK